MDLKDLLSKYSFPAWILAVVSFFSWIYLKVFYDQLGAIYNYSLYGSILDLFTFSVRNLEYEKGVERVYDFKINKYIFTLFIATLFWAVVYYVIYKLQRKKKKIKKFSQQIKDKLLLILSFIIIVASIEFILEQRFFFYAASAFIYFILVLFSKKITKEKLVIYLEDFKKRNSTTTGFALYYLALPLTMFSIIIVCCMIYHLAAILDSKMFMEDGFSRQKIVCLPEKLKCGHFVNDSDQYICLKEFNLKKSVCYKKDDLNEIVFRSDAHI